MYLTAVKEKALLLGDLSGAIIHPFFVHLANLAGVQFYQERLGRYCLLPILAGHLQSTLEALTTMKEEDDPISLARAYWAMTIVYAFPSAIRAAQRYLLRAVEIIRRNNIRFVRYLADSGSQLELSVPSILEPFSEEVHERVAFLADMLHVETYIYIAGQPGGPYYYHSENYYKFELPARIVFLPPIIILTQESVENLLRALPRQQRNYDKGEIAIRSGDSIPL